MADLQQGSNSADDSNFALIRDGVASYLNDTDPEETREWMESLDGLLTEASPDRARFLMLRLLERATARRVALPPLTSTDYVNTIPTSMEPEFPGDEDLEKRYRRWIRWNAAIMVHRAQRPGIGVGGHISTYASSAPLYEVGFNHFFRGKDHPGGGDHVFFQGHASPGMYARAFLEGRLDEDDLDGFRQEVSRPQGGMPSYPHPHGMPDFWEFPTVSMGLGPMDAIYQARFNRYLHNRGIKDTSDQHVWAFLGDGENLFVFLQARFDFRARTVADTHGHGALLRLAFVVQHAHIALPLALFHRHRRHGEHVFGIADGDGVLRGHTDGEFAVFIGHQCARVVVDGGAGGVGAGGVTALRHGGEAGVYAVQFRLMRVFRVG